jgi:hypothetical protein
VQLTGHREVLRPIRDCSFEVEQRRGRCRVTVQNGTGHKIAEHPNRMRHFYDKPGIGSQSMDLGRCETGCAAWGDRTEQRGRLREPTSQRLGQHPTPTARHQQTHQTPGPENVVNCSQRSGKIVNNFEDVVTKQKIGVPWIDHLKQPDQIALHSGHCAADCLFASSSP